MLKTLDRIFHCVRAVLSEGPNYLILFVTARCNLRCSHCFYLDEIENADRGKELSLREIEKISKTLPRLVQLTCTGGETFLRQDLHQIAHVFYKNSNTRFFTLTTNGAFPKRVAETVESILRQCPCALVRVPLSLDGVGAVNDRVRGREGSWEKALETYGLLKELSCRYDNLKIDVTSVLSKLNEGSMPELIDYVKNQMDVETHTIQNVRGRPALGPAGLASESGRYKDLLAQAAGRIKGGRSPLFSLLFGLLRRAEASATIEIHDSGTMPFICTAGDRLIEINEEGRIFPCEMLQTLIDEGIADAGGRFSDAWIGNVREYDCDVKKALSSEKNSKIREFIKNKGCACTFECAISASLAFEPSNYLRLIGFGRRPHG